MKRYTSDDKPSMYKADNGEFYLAEDVDPIIADRDIKAANLQLLVDAVLECEALDVACPGEGTEAYNGWYAALEALQQKTVNLARGLKQ